jgi:BstXI-like restriction endonuclease
VAKRASRPPKSLAKAVPSPTKPNALLTSYRSLPSLPQLLQRKIYKTGQTRGADDDVIYQNRVGRSSTVLIPYAFWPQCRVPSSTEPRYENGFIVLLSPTQYFGSSRIDAELDENGLALRENALVFYETREQWFANTPLALGWKPAKRRFNPLGGEYVARIPATTAAVHGEQIIRGFRETAMKGAGIRVYEYASTATNELCRLQLEALFWMCRDSNSVAISNGLTRADVTTRESAILELCRQHELLDFARLRQARIIDTSNHAICPLCLEELSAQGFFDRLAQAEGREVPDLTVTQLNLFHIEELRMGVLNHRPYNVGWGHHHCNVVVKDSGIVETLRWMQSVLERNNRHGHFPLANREG